jgi:hypothetical protein
VGWVRLRIRNSIEGAEIKIRYAELIRSSGKLDIRNLKES